MNWTVSEDAGMAVLTVAVLGDALASGAEVKVAISTMPGSASG